jgi:predicted nucleic-acid-binding protein
MIGLDTNVLVRYFSQDDAKQSKKASQVIEKELSKECPGFISCIVMVELCWVLTRLYQLNKADLCVIINGLLNAQDIEIEHREEVWKACRAFEEEGLDFPDVLLACIHKKHGCIHTVTFDKQAAKSDLFRLLK